MPPEGTTRHGGGLRAEIRRAKGGQCTCRPRADNDDLCHSCSPFEDDPLLGRFCSGHASGRGLCTLGA
jgi:hypothetical protein